MNEPTLFSTRDNLYRFELFCRYYTQSRKRWNYVHLGNMGHQCLYSLPKKMGLKSMLAQYSCDFNVYSTKLKRGQEMRVNIKRPSLLSDIAGFMLKPWMVDSSSYGYYLDQDHNHVTIPSREDLHELAIALRDDGSDMSIMCKHIISQAIMPIDNSDNEISFTDSIESVYCNITGDEEVLDDEHSITFEEYTLERIWFFLNAYIIYLYPPLMSLSHDDCLTYISEAIEDTETIEGIKDDIISMRIMDIAKYRACPIDDSAYAPIRKIMDGEL